MAVHGVSLCEKAYVVGLSAEYGDLHGVLGQEVEDVLALHTPGDKETGPMTGTPVGVQPVAGRRISRGTEWVCEPQLLGKV